MPVLAGKTDTGRIWVYVRDDKPFGGPAPPAAVFYYSRDRRHASPSASGQLHGNLAGQRLSGYGKLYEARAARLARSWKPPAG